MQTAGPSNAAAVQIDSPLKKKKNPQRETQSFPERSLFFSLQSQLASQQWLAVVAKSFMNPHRQVRYDRDIQCLAFKCKLAFCRSTPYLYILVLSQHALQVFVYHHTNRVSVPVSFELLLTFYVMCTIRQTHKKENYYLKIPQKFRNMVMQKLGIFLKHIQINRSK